MKIYVNSTLSVSQKEPLDCKEMAIKLSKIGIITSISSNISTQPHLEYGCNLKQSISSTDDLKKLWYELKKHYNFKCAHLNINAGFDGCINNYLSPNRCNSG